MASERLDLTPDVVKKALNLALQGTDSIVDFCDLRQPYLVLRVRGHVASWLVKTRDRSLKIGDAIPLDMAKKLPERRKRVSKVGNRYLGLRDAREQAKREWATLDGTTAPAPKPATWTWAELAAAYKAYTSGPRENSKGQQRHPSDGTRDDVERAFAQEAFQKWNSRSLVELNEDEFEALLEEVHEAKGWSAHRKVRAYVHAALTYGRKYRRRESGLTRDWWKMVPLRHRKKEEMEAKTKRKKRLDEVKRNFKVEHLGAVLAEHERYCLARSGNKRISPGVRWGLWWDALTAHRRGSGTFIALEDVQWTDPRGKPGWGLATWQPEIMKTSDEFTLPIPPLGIHILQCMLRDHKKACERAGMPNFKTRWLFASRVKQSKAGDIAASGSGLANHVRSLRGLRKHTGANHRDVLRGIPHFSMHTIRSTMGNFLMDRTDLPPGTASLMIDHAFPGDRLGELDKLAPTTKQHYVLAQRIPHKTAAMEAWSNALLEAFKAAGGIYPD